jgi:peptidoglycan hydrolase-like protein with peptidoglycan-binding domain
MPNPGQPTIQLGATGKVVRRLQRALRRTPNPTLPVDGVFSSQLEAVVKDFQEGAGLAADGIVGPLTGTPYQTGGPCLFSNRARPVTWSVPSRGC